MVDYIKALSLFCLSVAVASSEGKLIAISAFLGFVAFIMDKNRFYNIKNKCFNITFITFLFFVITMIIASLGISYHDGIKESTKYFEKITSFLIVYLLLGNVKNYFKITLLGLAIGFIANDYVLLKEVMASQLSVYDFRGGGLFGNPNKLGGVAALVVPFFIYFSIRYRQNIGLLLISILTIVGLCISLFVAGSRGAVLNIIVELIAICILYFHNAKIIKFSYKYFLLAGVVAVIASVAFISMNMRSYDYERVLVWTFALQMFKDYPLCGVGLGNFNMVYNSGYVSALAKEPNLVHPHNTYLLFLVETGIIGFIGYISTVITFITLWWKYRENDTSDTCNLKFTDIFMISLIGMIPHNLVDVVCIFRDQMLIQYLFWVLCCWQLNPDKNIVRE